MSEFTDMTNTNNTSGLKSETLLADRYRIREKVGQGGFSIVYDAEDTQTGRRVAVKECTIPSEKERFLREAKLLEDFADEDAVVTVLDFFEDGGTAYIVMEYLDGETLRSNIERNGRWDIEETVKRMSPVMKTLGRMHAKGVIHRDISPDNLMVIGDGRLILLDFGAARQYEDSTLSRMVVKASYSPPEQMDAKGIFGSWSDVYSVCAAIYFCITGSNPEDAISRLMLDELKKPSELGAKILPAAEKTLMRGMALDSKERIGSMEQLRTELENTYPPLSPEEKLALKRRKRNRIIAAAITAAAVAAVALVIINIDNIRAAYHYKTGTETIIIDGTGMDDEEFEANAAKAEARMSVMSGQEAKYERFGHTIAMEIPADTFGVNDAETAEKWVNCAVSAPMELLVSDGEIPIGYLRPAEDIKSFNADGDTATIEFSETGQIKFRDYLSEEGKSLEIRSVAVFGHEPDFYIDGVYKYNADTAGDGKTITIGPEVGHFYLAELLFTEDPLTKAFATTAVTEVKWEDPGKAGESGAHQVAEEELKDLSANGNTLRLKYRVKTDSYDGERRDIENVKKAPLIMKQRLDALDIPYAIGTGKYDEELIIVDVPASSVDLEKAALLGCAIRSIDFKISGLKVSEFDSTSSWTGSVKLSDAGTNSFPVIPKNSDDLDDRQKFLEYLESLKSDGETHLYLKYDEVPIAKTGIDDAIAAVEDDKDLQFDEWCAADGREEDVKALFNYMISQFPIQEESPFDDVLCRLEDMQNIDKDGHITCYDNAADSTFECEQRADSYIDDWNRRYDGMMTFNRTYFGVEEPYYEVNYGDRLYIYDKRTYGNAESVIENFCEVYRDNKEKLEDGTFKHITYETCGKYIYILADADGNYYISTVPEISGVDAKEIISRDSELKHLITTETSVW